MQTNLFSNSRLSRRSVSNCSELILPSADQTGAGYAEDSPITMIEPILTNPGKELPIKCRYGLQSSLTNLIEDLT